jgi:hypothetical protein
MKLAAVQQGVYDRLSGVTAITDAVTGIYTSVPQSPESEDASSFPYITIGPVSVTPDDTKTDDGSQALVDVHIWSRSTSALTWRAIADDVYDALQKYDALTVTGADVIDCRFDSSAEFDDPDGVTKHQIGTYRISYRFAE